MTWSDTMIFVSTYITLLVILDPPNPVRAFASGARGDRMPSVRAGATRWGRLLGAVGASA